MPKTSNFSNHPEAVRARKARARKKQLQLEKKERRRLQKKASKERVKARKIMEKHGINASAYMTPNGDVQPTFQQMIIKATDEELDLFVANQNYEDYEKGKEIVLEDRKALMAYTDDLRAFGQDLCTFGHHLVEKQAETTALLRKGGELRATVVESAKKLRASARKVPSTNSQRSLFSPTAVRNLHGAGTFASPLVGEYFE